MNMGKIQMPETDATVALVWALRESVIDYQILTLEWFILGAAMAIVFLVLYARWL